MINFPESEVEGREEDSLTRSLLDHALLTLSSMSLMHVRAESAANVLIRLLEFFEVWKA